MYREILIIIILMCNDCFNNITRQRVEVVIPLGTIEIYASWIEILALDICQLRGLNFEYWKFWVIIMPHAVLPVISEDAKRSKSAFANVLLILNLKCETLREVFEGKTIPARMEWIKLECEIERSENVWHQINLELKLDEV